MKSGCEKPLFRRSSGINDKKMVWTTADNTVTANCSIDPLIDNMALVACQNGPSNHSFSVFPPSDPTLTGTLLPTESLEKQDGNRLNIRKTLGRHGSSLPRAPRWFPRKTPFRQRQASPSRDKIPSKCSKKLSDTNLSSSSHYLGTSPVPDKFDGDFWSVAQYTSTSRESKHQSTNESPIRYSTLSNCCSATWTHRDFLVHRQAIYDLAHETLKPDIAFMESSTEMAQLPGFNQRPSNCVCFPMELSALGHEFSSSSTVTSSFYHSSKERKKVAFYCDSANPRTPKSWLASAAEHVRSLFSFVHISTDVSTVLRRYTQCADNHPISSTSTPFDTEDNSSWNFSSSSPPQKLVYPERSETLGISIKSISPKPVIKPQIDSHTGHLLPESLESRSTNRCLSRACPGHSYGPETYLSDDAESCNLITSSSKRLNWCRQLFEIVRTSLTNVNPTMYDQKLRHLIKCAAQQQRANEPHGPDRTDTLFDACVFTDLAVLLATYTFPLRARVKIQSAFLGLEMYELLTDAKDVLLEVESLLNQHPELLSTGENRTQ